MKIKQQIDALLSSEHPASEVLTCEQVNQMAKLLRALSEAIVILPDDYQPKEGEAVTWCVTTQTIRLPPDFKGGVIQFPAESNEVRIKEINGKPAIYESELMKLMGE